MMGENEMTIGDLFFRAVKSGCICSVFYHGLMLVTGQSVTVQQAFIFTVVFIGLYFLWLVLVSKRK